MAKPDVTLISSTEAERTSCGKLLPAPAVPDQTFQLGHTKEASPVHSRAHRGTSEGLRKQLGGGEPPHECQQFSRGAHVLNCAPKTRVPAPTPPPSAASLGPLGPASGTSLVGRGKRAATHPPACISLCTHSFGSSHQVFATLRISLARFFSLLSRDG